MNLSILQGRLSKPVEGYQETPKNWKREFDLLGNLGLSHIEWVTTKDQFLNNPLFRENLLSYNISTICIDNIIDTNIFNRDFFIGNVYPVCDAAIKNGINSVSIPLLEESEVTSSKKKKMIIDLLVECCKRYPQLHVNIEAELDAESLMEIVFSHENLKITYDTGNLTAMNVDHEVYIDKTIDKITNVHLKDRKSDRGPSMKVNDGDTDFNTIFKSLSRNEYAGFYTLQVARGESGKEVDYIKTVTDTFRRIHVQYF